MRERGRERERDCRISRSQYSIIVIYWLKKRKQTRERERKKDIRHCMVCASVREDNPRALQKQNHTYMSMYLYLVHCEIFDVKHWNISKSCNNVSMGIFIFTAFFLNGEENISRILLRKIQDCKKYDLFCFYFHAEWIYNFAPSLFEHCYIRIRSPLAQSELSQTIPLNHTYNVMLTSQKPCLYNNKFDYNKTNGYSIPKGLEDFFNKIIY